MEENNKINMPTLAAAIAYTNSHGGGGGGGTSNYNDLSNKPQIGGTTLTGNKSASDLGLVAAVEGKGLSTNDYTDADKAIVGGVTAALAGKQNVLTEGNNIKIDNNTISVNRWAVPAGKVVYTVITSDENYGQNVHVQRHTLGGALIDDRTFLCEMYKTVTIDDLISIYNPYASFKITLLKNSDEHQAGYSYTVNPITTPTSNSFTFMMEQEENDNDLIIRSELDEKQDTLTFDDTPTDNSNNPVKSNGIYDALELKQDATDDSLETTDKTIVGAINEHEGDISSLKSGLTNVQDDVNLNTNDLTTPSRTKNLLLIDLPTIKAFNEQGTWDGNSYTRADVTYTLNFDGNGNLANVTVNGTASADGSLKLVLQKDLPLKAGSQYIVSGSTGGSANTYAIDCQAFAASQDGDSEPFTYNTSYPDYYILIVVKSGVSLNNKVFYPMVRIASDTDPTYAPYIPSVESRIEAVESGLTNVNNNLSSLGASADLSNWNDYPDFNGKYVIIGKLCIFNLSVTKGDSSWNLAGIANQQAAIDNTAVAYDAVNQKRIFAKNTTGAIVLQLQTTDTYTNPTNVSGCIVLA